ncbi:MFS transporter [Streptomyces sp. NPDC001594]|uniref:MFS transporter n=1 Tax=Streptomyces sp. NPDC001594 TaxID=3364590 RepID=UPI00367DAB6C
MRWTLALPPRSYPWQVPGTVLAGIGMGMPVPALSAELMRAVPRRDRADASVLRQTLRQLGGAVGLALAGALVLAANDDTADAEGIVTATATPAAFVTAAAFLTTALLSATLLLPPGPAPAPARPQRRPLARDGVRGLGGGQADVPGAEVRGVRSRWAMASATSSTARRTRFP